MSELEMVGNNVCMIDFSQRAEKVSVVKNYIILHKIYLRFRNN